MSAIFKKEFKSYFYNMTGYVFIAFLLVASGIFMSAYNLLMGSPFYENSLMAMDFIFLAVIPLITMNSFAPERRNKTDQLLLTAPVKISHIVMGKLFAMLAVLLIPVLIMGVYPLILTSFGEVNLATAYSSLFAFFLLGSALISIGMFISSSTESSVISAIATIGVFILLYFMKALSGMLPTTSKISFLGIIIIAIIIAIIIQLLTKNSIVAIASLAVLAGAALAVYLIAPDLYNDLLPSILEKLAIFEGIDIFANGKFDLSQVIYYISVIFIFGFLTVRSIDKRRWN